MATNDKYRLFGGILYNTPADETSNEIVSENFKTAQLIADELLNACNIEEIMEIMPKLNDTIINYMNSPFIDFIIMHKKSYELWLSKACIQGDLEVVKYLMERCVYIDIINTPTITNAAYNGHLDIVKYLHGSGVSIKLSHFMYHSPLYNATLNNQPKVVEYLIEHGIEEHIVNDSILENAAATGNLTLVKYLVNHNARNTHAIIGAVKNNRFDIVKYFNETAEDIVQSQINYIIETAASYDRLEMMKYFIEQNQHNVECLHRSLRIACHNNCLSIVIYLAELGVTTNPIVMDQAIKKACQRGNFTIIKYFIEKHYIDLTIHSIPILTSAIEHGDIDMFKIVVQNNIDIRAHIDMLLIGAANRSQHNIVKYLKSLRH